MLKGYKYRIYPTTAQQRQIDATMSVCRYVYNLGLEIKTTAWKSASINVTAYELQRQFTQAKKEFPWLGQASRAAVDNVLNKLDDSFSSFFNGAGYPRFRSKKGRQSFSCSNDVKRLDFDQNLLTISRIPNIPIRISRRFDGEIRTITISRTPTGKYYAAILAKQVRPIPQKMPVIKETAIGLDIGLKSFIVSSDGRVFQPNRKLGESLNRLKCLQRRVSRKKKGGANFKKSALRLSILHEKITNRRSDYIHKTTTKLICESQADTLVIEQLNVGGMLKNGKLAKSIADASFGEFSRQMKYKCDWYGKNLIVIGLFTPSSKRCSDCGKINSDLTLSDREWICSCGAHHDRDLNAAYNIKHYGLEQYSRRDTPVEPVELSALAEAKKQEVAIKNSDKSIPVKSELKSEYIITKR